MARHPMLCIALDYHCMIRADPDCGKTFALVTRAMGPQLGWLGTGVIVAAAHAHTGFRRGGEHA